MANTEKDCTVHLHGFVSTVPAYNAHLRAQFGNSNFWALGPLKLAFILGMHNLIMSTTVLFLNCDIGSDEDIVIQMKSVLGVSQTSGVSEICRLVAESQIESGNRMVSA